MPEKLKILIVDDRDENLASLKQLLDEVDAEIICAGSGEEALAATVDHDFALAILDVMMPGMNGYELAECLREDKKTLSIPIIFLSAIYSDQTNIIKGYMSGAVDYIVKPYKPELLLGKVKVFLELAGARKLIEQRNINLEKLVAERTATLNESLKQLRCLYSITSLFSEHQKLINEILQSVVNLIPAGLHHPDKLCARIYFDDRLYITQNFRETPWMISVDLPGMDGRSGAIEVFYLEERFAEGGHPFSLEETAVIEAISLKVGSMLLRKLIELELRESESRLKNALDDVLRQNEELDAFSHTVAHDLKNPLSLIISYSELLIEEQDTLAPELRNDAICAINRSGKKMYNIIDALIMFSNVRKLQAPIESVDMKSTIQEALQHLHQADTNLSIEIIGLDDWPDAQGYAPWIEEMWKNYLSNAMKYGGDPPSISIGAEVLKMPHAGNYVKYWVRDNGKGLTSDEIARLFRPFSRLDTARAEGHGLGLSIVRRIAKKLGGTAGVESDGLPGKGCVFYFTLPAIDSYS